MTEEGNQEFKRLIRVMHQFIKAHHHLSKIQNSDNGEPQYLRRTTEKLEKSVKAAIPTPTTELMLFGNARKWLDNSLNILANHYTESIQNLGTIIKITATNTWKPAWQVAIRWARRNLKRLQETTIQETTEIVTKLIEGELPGSIEQNQKISRYTPKPEEHTVEMSSKDEPPQTSRSSSPVPHKCRKNHKEQTLTEKTEKMAETNTNLKPPHINMPSTATSLRISTKEPTGQTPTHPETETTTNQPSGNDHSTGSSETPTTEETICLTRHAHRGDKYRNWYLKPKKPIMILGDSNLCKLPKIRDHRVQMDSYPGAQIAHACHILKYKTATKAETQKVILSFGINNRSQYNPGLLKKQLNLMIEAAESTFPNATVHIPIINFNHKLPLDIQNNIKTLNETIKQTGKHIPRLPDPEFHTTDDGIHWTPQTGRAMLTHWLNHLN